MNPQTINSDERIMAAFAHASVVSYGLGIIIAFIIWLTQKEKSAYAAGQGLQAAVYQLVGLIITVGLWFLWGVFYALSMIPLLRNPDQYEAAPPTIFWVGFGSMVVPLIFMFLLVLYGLWGAIKCWQGQDFRYVIIGKYLPK
jgi:uncharacterized Tic20 family protein